MLFLKSYIYRSNNLFIYLFICHIDNSVSAEQMNSFVYISYIKKNDFTYCYVAYAYFLLRN